MPVDSPNVGVAFALVCGAGAATALGASVVFFPTLVKLASRRVLASALGFSAGVMIYVSFVDIFQKTTDSFGDAGYNDGDAFAYTTLCFFGGVVIMVMMDAVIRCITCGGHHDAHPPDDHHRHQDPIEKSQCAHEQVKTNPDVLTPHCFTCTDDPVGELEAWQHIAKHQAANDGHREGIIGAESSSSEYDDIENDGGQMQSMEEGTDFSTTSRSHDTETSRTMPNVAKYQAANDNHREGTAESTENDIENNGGTCQMQSVEEVSDSFGHNHDNESFRTITPGVAKPQATDENHREGAAESTVDDIDGVTIRQLPLVAEGSDTSTSNHTHDNESSRTITPNVEKDKERLVHMGFKTAFAICLHNFPEGLATFVTALNDPKVGAVLAIAIGIHNIPEGLCVALPIYYATGQRWKAFLWACISGISEPIAALLGWAVLANAVSDIVYAVLFGLVGGMMVIISIKELLPTAHRYDPEDTVVTYSFIGGMAILALSLVLFVV